MLDMNTLSNNVDGDDGGGVGNDGGGEDVNFRAGCGDSLKKKI